VSPTEGHAPMVEAIAHPATAGGADETQAPPEQKK